MRQGVRIGTLIEGEPLQGTYQLQLSRIQTSIRVEERDILIGKTALRMQFQDVHHHNLGTSVTYLANLCEHKLYCPAGNFGQIEAMFMSSLERSLSSVSVRVGAKRFDKEQKSAATNAHKLHL